MPQSLAFPMTAASHAAPLFGIAALFVGGAGLVFFSVRGRGQVIARRLDLVRGEAVADASLKPAGGLDEYRFTDQAQGLSIPEQRQIAKVFDGYGVAPDRAILLFTLLRLAGVLAAALIAFVAASRTAWPLPLLAATAAAITAWFLPIVPVKIAVKKHRTAVAAGLPDAIELMAICADAGVSLESGLQRVAQELRNSQPALASELALTWAQIALFPNRDQALLNLADRINLPSLRWVVTTLSQSMRFGTPLAQSLRVAAAEMRNDRLVQLEERANRLPTLLTLPVMLLIMPTIFLIVGGPAALRIIDTFTRTSVAH